MASFDPKDYEQKVVRPLRGRGGRLPDDLVSRYAVRLDFSDGELAERIAQIRSHWNKSAQSTAKSSFVRSVYKAFLREDEELRREHGERMLRISWWREHDAARTGSRRQQVDELVAMLHANFGELGLITSGQLEAMRETFSLLAPEEVDRALETAGVRLSNPVELPRASGLRETTYRRLKSLLADAEMSSIAELVLGELTSLRVLTTFACTPAHPAGLTAEAVRQAIDRENRRSGNQAAREALGILNTAVTSDGVDLRLLTLFHLLDDVRRHHDNRAPASVLLRHLRQAKLAESEARQAVVSVLGESGGRGPAPPSGLPGVTELLRDGCLAAAEQALTGITDAEEAESARRLVERQGERVRELRSAAHRALVAGEETEARQRLLQAAALATDDDRIAAELRRIPPPPVLEVSAQPEGTGVRVSWRVPAEHENGTVYRVVRRNDRVPADPADGEVVAEDTAMPARDTTARAGVRVGYAVFAAHEQGAWSRPVGARIEVLPPVHGVRLRTVQGVVEASWKVHPDAIAVDVRRDDGSRELPVATTGTTSFRDTGTTPGVDYTYVLTARYRRSDGTEASSEPVRAESTSRVVPALPPVGGLEFRRFDEELVLSWVWPERAGVAEVVWNGSAGSGRYRLTRQEYQASGGCRLRTGAGPVRVRVSALAAAEDGAACSAPTEIDIDGRQPHVGYTVERRSRPLVGGGTARITLTADQPVPACTVLVVAAQGRVMPLQPADGQVIGRVEGELRPGRPVETTVEVPKLRRPYWLRCFTETAGVRLVDPPTAQLKAT
ncbi:hypothetical protein HUO13_23395 [Saccharopolyspora erythraea]|uniref:hypothetical protein n=1 Tax=Saccharopolyspora erythraea TaxID=1836 RepID=UPI001BA70D6A|nr:hypothetical protein [Saccharopolyspora erythraea]QUH03376.1 hypothetical protein HUO13_23395 [Saccharopolyspora erythraea]